jgi:hypothetical protein
MTYSYKSPFGRAANINMSLDMTIREAVLVEMVAWLISTLIYDEVLSCFYCFFYT